jgi:hypothetical protein
MDMSQYTSKRWHTVLLAAVVTTPIFGQLGYADEQENSMVG